MKDKFIFLKSFLILMFIPILLRAQSDHSFCGTDHRMEETLRRNPQLREITNRFEDILAQRHQLGLQARISDNTVYEIPVMVHLFQDGPIGSTNNPTNAKVQEMLDYEIAYFQIL